MLTDALDIIGIGLLLTATALAVLGVVSFLRLPDLYSRIHAANMVITGGAVPLFLALLFLADSRTGLKALATAAFLLVTTPLVTHVLARTAYRRGVDLGPVAARDDLAAASPGGTRGPAPSTGGGPGPGTSAEDT